MKKEIRTVVYDEDLEIEAYRFEGIVKPFPNHFHEHYVIGFVEAGERRMSCRNREYTLRPGNMVLFNPGDSHACVQCDGGAFDYRGFNIGKETMLKWAEEATGIRELPGFFRNVAEGGEAICYLRSLHEMVMKGGGELGKEENLLLLLSELIQKYGQPFPQCIPECREEIERACAFMQERFRERISLDDVCREAGLSKSALLRAFAKDRGVTPYRYLEAIRINEAKRLLAEGVSPLEAAIRTGFSDQSHFTNYFSSFIGLAPGVYRDIFSEKKED